MVSLRKRIVSLTLAASMLLSTPAFATGLEPVFSADLSSAEESVQVTGSAMAAVNMNFTTESASYGSFTSMGEAESEDVDAAVALDGGENGDISDYRYFPDTGETVGVTSPVFPEIYPSHEEPSEEDKALDAVDAAYSAGDVRDVVDSDGYSRQVKCLYVGTYCTVWGSTEDNYRICIDSSIARSIGQEFDSNYLATVEGFGSGIDADGDGKVAIFCYDIDQDYGYSVSTYTAGFFRMADMVNASGYVDDVYFGTSNYVGMGVDCIHIDTYPGMSAYSNTYLDDVSSCYSTLIHEYQHLINFSHWVNADANGERMPTYMNEAFSMAAEHMVCGSEETASRIEYFNDSSRYVPGHPLTYWNTGSSISNYSNSYLFGQYLRTRYAQMTGTNGNAIYKEIMETWSGYVKNNQSVNELTVAASILGTTPDQLILDFWAAVYLLDASGPYGFNGESWANTISPIISTSKSSIGAGSAKFYTLSSGSYTPSTSSDLSFIGFTASGGVQIPGAPQITDMSVERTSASAATVTFNASKAGYLWYEFSNDETMDEAAMSNIVAINKGSNTLEVSLSAGENEETRFWYYAQGDGGKTSISYATVYALSYGVYLDAPVGGTVTLTVNGTEIQSGDFVPRGATVTVTVAADEGYTLQGIYVDDAPISGTAFTVTGTHIVTVVFDIAAATAFAGGSGTQADPFRIETAGQLKYFANRVNGGDSMEGSYILLANDIDMTGISLDVIGPYSSRPFAGTFDGGRHTISNLSITANGKQNVGLFGYNTGTITDLRLTSARIESVYEEMLGYVGGITAYNEGTVAYCSVSGFMYAKRHQVGYVGGITGYNKGTVLGCVGDIHTTADDEDISYGMMYAGGIAGYNHANGTVEGCSSFGRASVYYNGNESSSAYAGGIVGYNLGSVKNCLRTNNVDPYGGTAYAGGIVGYVSGGTVEGCYYYCLDRTVSAYGKAGYAAYAGGIAGYVGSSAAVKNSVAYGKGVNASTVSASKEYEGRVVGGYHGSATVSGCYYYTSMTCSNATNSLGTAASSANLLSEGYLSSNVGMDFTSGWELGVHPDETCPTPQAICRVEGYRVTLEMNGAITELYAYAGTDLTVSAGDEKYYVKSLTVDGAAVEGDTFTVTGEHTVTVELGSCYAITVTGSESGSISAPAYVIPGEKVTVTAVDTLVGYTLGGLVVNGETVWTTTFTPTGDTTVTPIFVAEGTAGAYGENIWWVVRDTDENGTYETLYISGAGAMDEPASAEYVPWLASYSGTLTHAYIAEGVTTVMALCFENCSELTSVSLPDSLTYIGCDAFLGCTKLTSMEIPDGVKTMDEAAFYGCSALTVVRLGTSLETIGSYAFYNCSRLSEIVMHKSVTSVGAMAFARCTALTDVYYVGTAADKAANMTIADSNDPLNNATWHYVSSADELTSITVADCEHGIITVKDYAEGKIILAGTEQTVKLVSTDPGYRFVGFTVNGVFTEGTTFTVPKAAKVTVQGVFEQIGDHHAAGRVTDYVNWAIYDEDADGTPETLLVYGSGAMSAWSAASGTPWYAYQSSIETLIVEKGVTNVGAYAFYGCTKLSHVVLPVDGFGTIGKYAFYGCTALKEITVPNSLSYIYERAFYNAGLTSLVLGSGVKSVGSYAFYGTALAKVYYAGSSTNWSSISVSSGNTKLTGTTRTYGVTLVTPTVTQGENGLIYLPGVLSGGQYTAATVTAAGYTFSHLTVDGQRVNSRTFTVPASGTVSVSAVFGKAVAMEIAAVENGTLTLSCGSEAAVGSIVTATAVPALGYVFSHLTVNGEAVEGLTFTVPDAESVTVGAVFTSVGETVDGGECGTGVYWGLMDTDADGTGETLLIYGSGAMKDYSSSSSGRAPWYAYRANITAVTVSEGVTSVGNYAFHLDYDALKTVTLADSVTSIGIYAFYSCEALTDIALNEGLTSIGNYAFYGCDALKTVDLPDSVTTLGESVYSNCTALTEIRLGTGVTAIPKRAFYSCLSVDAVIFSKSVKSIGASAFLDTTPKAVYFVGAAADWNAISISSAYYTSYVVDEGNTSLVEAQRFYAPAYSDIIPATVEESEFGLLYAPKYLVRGAEMSVCVGSADAGYVLSSYTVNGTVCTDLTYTIPADAESVTLKGTFTRKYDVSLGGVCGPNAYWMLTDADGDGTEETLTVYGSGDMTAWSVKANVPWDGYRAQIKAVAVEEGITSIGNYAFYGCDSMTEITLADTLTTVGKYAFAYSDGFTEITLPDSVTVIGESAFYYCLGMKCFRVPAGVTTLEEDTLGNCSALGSMIVPKTLKRVNSSAISSVSLKDVYYVGTTTDKNGLSVFAGNSTFVNATWHYIDSEDELIRVNVIATDVGSVILPVVVVRGESVTAKITKDTRPGYELVGLSVNGTVVEGDTFTVPSVGESFTVQGLFECKYEGVVDGGWCGTNARWLITTDNQLVIYGSGAMSNYSTPTASRAPWLASYSGKITSVTVEEGITDLGTYAFYQCTALKSFTLPAVMTDVPTGLLRGCTRLETVTLHENITTIGEYAFADCDRLAEIEIPDSVTSISAHAFYDCSSLTSVEIPASVTTLGDYVFYNTPLQSVILHKELTNLDYGVFYSCDELIDVYYYGTEADRANIYIDGNNASLTNATWHYISDDSGFVSLTVVNGEEGAVEVKGAITGSRLYEGLSYTVRAVSAKAGYRLTGIKVNGAEQQSLTFTVPVDAESITVEGVFTKLYDAEVGGVCGEDAYWLIQNDGTLLIYGSGAVTTCAWSSYSSTIRFLDVSEGITSFAGYIFRDQTAMESIRLPKSLETVAGYAFSGCSALRDVYYAGSEEDRAAISITNNPSLVNAAWHYNVSDEDFVPFTLQGVEGLVLTVPGTLPGSIMTGRTYTAVIESVMPGWYCEALMVNGERVEGKTFTVPADAESITVAPVLTKVVDADVGGKCGTDAFWAMLDTDGDGTKETLTIYGSGAMADYASSSSAPWYSYKSSIKALDIRHGITHIGKYAFYNYKMTAAALPDSVETVGERAFYYCYALRSFYGGKSLVSIDSYAFGSCSALRAVYLPVTLTTVNSSAFSSCGSLTDVYYGGTESDKAGITIKSDSYLTAATWHYASDVAVIEVASAAGGVISVTDLPVTAFAEKGTQWTVEVESAPPGYRFSGLSVNGVSVEGKTFTVPCGGKVTVAPVFTKVVESTVGGFCGEKAYWALVDADSDGTAEKLVIYGEGDMQNYSDGSAMPWYNYRSRITSVEVMSGITSVGDHAFYYCGALQTVELPEGIASIGNRAFYNCDALKSVELPEGVASVSDYAFFDCDALQAVKLPATLLSVGSYAFYSCEALAAVEIPSGVTALENFVFAYCYALESIVLPKSVASVGDYAFADCSKLGHVFYEGSEADRAAMTVSGTGNADLTDATWHYGVSAADIVTITVTESEFGAITAPAMAAKGESVTFAVTSFVPGYQATGLVVNGMSVEGLTLTLSSGGSITVSPVFTKVVEAEIGGFCGERACWALTDADSDGTAEKLVIYGEGDMQDYTYGSAVPWYNYRSQITSAEIMSGITSVGSYAFYNCDVLKSADLPEGVTSIGNYAFAYNRALAEVELPAGLISIGDYAFYYCDALPAVKLPAGLISIGDRAFYYCDDLTAIDLPDSVTSLGAEAFSCCYALTQARLGAGITVIPTRLFAYNRALASVELPAGLTTIGEYAFYNCAALTAIHLPAGLTTIAHGAFASAKLTAVEIPASVTTIGGYAFSYNNFTSVVIPAGITTIEKNTFEYCDDLVSVVLPKSVASVGDYAFTDCSKLGHVFYEGSEADRAAMTVSGTNNAKFTDAVWHYGVAAEDVAAITVTESEFGTLTAPAMAAKGESVTLTAEPVLGYGFSHLLVNGERVEGLTFTVPSGGEITVSAVYERLSTQVSVREYTGYYIFTLYQFDAEEACAYVTFYDANGKMVKTCREQTALNTKTDVTVYKSNIPGAASCKVIFTDNAARALDQATVVPLG